MSDVLKQMVREGRMTPEEYEAVTGENVPTFTIEGIGGDTAVALDDSTAVA